MEINLENLDKSKIYCNICLKEGELSELIFDKDKKVYTRPCCPHQRTRNFYSLVFRNESWEVVRGTDPNAISQKEKVLENTKPGLCSLCKKFVFE